MPKETQSFTFDTDLGNAVLTFKNPAQLNQMWGSIASQVGQSGIMGEHSSSHGFFTPDPGEGGRQGVGNLSKTDEDFLNPDPTLDGNPLSEGSQGLHGLFQGVRLGDPTLVPPDIVEETVGPFLPETHGNVSITPVDFSI
jgi:hypothetical protein